MRNVIIRAWAAAAAASLCLFQSAGCVMAVGIDDVFIEHEEAAATSGESLIAEGNDLDAPVVAVRGTPEKLEGDGEVTYTVDFVVGSSWGGDSSGRLVFAMDPDFVPETIHFGTWGSYDGDIQVSYKVDGTEKTGTAPVTGLYTFEETENVTDISLSCNTEDVYHITGLMLTGHYEPSSYEGTYEAKVSMSVTREDGTEYEAASTSAITAKMEQPSDTDSEPSQETVDSVPDSTPDEESVPDSAPDSTTEPESGTDTPVESTPESVPDSQESQAESTDQETESVPASQESPAEPTDSETESVPDPTPEPAVPSDPDAKLSITAPILSCDVTSLISGGDAASITVGGIGGTAREFTSFEVTFPLGGLWIDSVSLPEFTHASYRLFSGENELNQDFAEDGTVQVNDEKDIRLVLNVEGSETSMVKNMVIHVKGTGETRDVDVKATAKASDGSSETTQESNTLKLAVVAAPTPTPTPESEPPTPTPAPVNPEPVNPTPGTDTNPVVQDPTPTPTPVPTAIPTPTPTPKPATRGIELVPTGGSSGSIATGNATDAGTGIASTATRKNAINLTGVSASSRAVSNTGSRIQITNEPTGDMGDGDSLDVIEAMEVGAQTTPVGDANNANASANGTVPSITPANTAEEKDGSQEDEPVEETGSISNRTNRKARTPAVAASTGSAEVKKSSNNALMWAGIGVAGAGAAASGVLFFRKSAMEANEGFRDEEEPDVPDPEEEE